MFHLSPTQACSAKSLERLRNQQESLRSLKPQVVYLKDLAQGLVQDSPQTPGGSAEGARRLQMQAEETEKEYDDVTEKVRAAAAGVVNLSVLSESRATRAVKEFCLHELHSTHATIVDPQHCIAHSEM